MVRVYFWIALVIFATTRNIESKNLKTSKTKDCPEVCACLGTYVDCSSKKFETIPSLLPKWTTHLNLHNNSIRKLNSNAWRHLVKLTELKLSKNEITSIPKNIFEHQEQLRILELNRNHIKDIDALTFTSLQHLTALKLKRNDITQLKDGTFYGLNKIIKLILDYNSIKVVTKGWLYGLKTLKELSLSHNNISYIEAEAWELCKILVILDLSHNELTSIKIDTFKYLGDLQKLMLNNNNITFIEENAFNHLPNLKYLHLSNNKISWAIEDANGAFQGLNHLTKLHLATNNIKAINQNAFVGLKKVTNINLTDNNISSIQKNAFSEMPLLTDLVMNTTSLICDCNLRWFSEWLILKNFSTIQTVCAYPSALRGQNLIQVPTENFTCDELPKPRLIEEPEQEIMALKGENISLSCKAMSSSSSIMTFKWKKDNVELSNVVTTVRTNSIDGKNTESVSNLNIFHVQHSDAGKYQCVVSNNYGSTYSQKSSISVLIFPNFTKTPSNVTVQAGEVAKLECAAHGEPQPEIAWQKDGGNDFPAARERRMHVMPTDDTFFIVNVKTTDMGVYSCTAHNAAGTVVVNASLVVQEKPSFSKEMEDKEVTAGDLVVLQCMASGSPKPNITWLKDGEPITATERHFFTAEDQLMIIVDTVQSDSGQYQCNLNNSLGQENGFSRLTVKPTVITTTDMMGIIIITVVCCAVMTSFIWVIIIYHTQRRMSPNNAMISSPDVQLEDFTEAGLAHFADNTSDRSSSKDSGTGDSAKTDELAPEEYALTAPESAPKSKPSTMRAASLVYFVADHGTSSHMSLLRPDAIALPKHSENLTT